MKVWCSEFGLSEQLPQDTLILNCFSLELQDPSKVGLKPGVRSGLVSQWESAGLACTGLCIYYPAVPKLKNM